MVEVAVVVIEVLYFNQNEINLNTLNKLCNA